MINIFTDGACNGNKSGGWAFHISDLNVTVCNKEKNTTNNRMELMAIYQAVLFIRTSSIIGDLKIPEVTINSDSAWAIGAITKNWNITENLDLVTDIKELIKKTKTHIMFNKVKGHSNIKENEIADTFAVIMSNYDK